MSAGQGSRKLTDAQWQAWIDAFRMWPDAPSKVAAKMKSQVGRAGRLWRIGQPLYGRPPIKDIIDAEKVLVHQAVLDREADPEEGPRVVVLDNKSKQHVDKMVDAERSRLARTNDMIARRAEEADLVKITRQNSLALAGVSARLLMKAIQLGDRLDELLDDTTISLRDAMQVLRQTAAIVRLNNEAAKMAVQMERLLLGAPTGDDDDEDSDGRKTLTPESARRWIEEAAEAIRRAEQRGLLRAGHEGAQAPVDA